MLEELCRILCVFTFHGCEAFSVTVLDFIYACYIGCRSKKLFCLVLWVILCFLLCFSILQIFSLFMILWGYIHLEFSLYSFLSSFFLVLGVIYTPAIIYQFAWVNSLFCSYTPFVLFIYSLGNFCARRVRSYTPFVLFPIVTCKLTYGS